MIRALLAGLLSRPSVEGIAGAVLIAALTLAGNAAVAWLLS
jgi:hypothetical protein